MKCNVLFIVYLSQTSFTSFRSSLPNNSVLSQEAMETGKKIGDSVATTQHLLFFILVNGTEIIYFLGRHILSNKQNFYFIYI